MGDERRRLNRPNKPLVGLPGVCPGGRTAPSLGMEILAGERERNGIDDVGFSPAASESVFLATDIFSGVRESNGAARDLASPASIWSSTFLNIAAFEGDLRSNGLVVPVDFSALIFESVKSAAFDGERAKRGVDAFGLSFFVGWRATFEGERASIGAGILEVLIDLILAARAKEA